MRIIPSRTQMAIMGTALGAVATYVATKPSLRRELQKAESTREAVDILGRHLRLDSAEISREARALMRSQTVQRRLGSVRRWVGQKRSSFSRKSEPARTSRASARRPSRSVRKSASRRGAHQSQRAGEHHSETAKSETTAQA